MSDFSKRTEFDLSSVVASGMTPLVRNVAVKSGVKDIKFGQVVIIKTTGAEAWNGADTNGKLAISTVNQVEGQTSLRCLVVGCYLASKVHVNSTPISAAQQLTLMSSTLFNG
ncbi:hypothetical protein ACPV36_04900 [Photobacterium damselae]|uniref:hypothetical protein n=1 Tax=Photobacterium damselae TaxID=38293 RepID=UPI004068E9D2